MKKLMAAIRYRLLPRHYSEALSGISDKPLKWDIPAVQLNEHREHVAAIRYPQYLYGLLCAARTAHSTGEETFTAIEFGVAGGNGLVAMEKHARLVEKLWPVKVNIVGFDMSTGLPPRDEPRDCPFAFGGGAGGEFSMNESALRARLQGAELRLGDVSETTSAFAKESFAPIGFVSNDLDLYTSTRDSLQLFKLDASRYLPRIHMYFDDLTGYPYTTENAEWAAINDFNKQSESRKLGLIYGLNHGIGPLYRFAPWPEKIFVLELFDHDKFNLPESTTMPDLSLR
jgi:hypothetical protein